MPRKRQVTSVGGRTPLPVDDPSDALAPASRAAAADDTLRESLRELLRRNAREGYSALLGQHYSYIAPAPATYPFQWFWDTCFHVIMLARLGEFDMAKRNLRSLFAMQDR